MKGSGRYEIMATGYKEQAEGACPLAMLQGKMYTTDIVALASEA